MDIKTEYLIEIETMAGKVSVFFPETEWEEPAEVRKEPSTEAAGLVFDQFINAYGIGVTGVRMNPDIFSPVDLVRTLEINDSYHKNDAISSWKIVYGYIPEDDEQVLESAAHEDKIQNAKTFDEIRAVFDEVFPVDPEQESISKSLAAKNKAESDFQTKAIIDSILQASSKDKKAIAETMTIDQAKALIARLDAAPGDDFEARRAVIAVYPELSKDKILESTRQEFQYGCVMAELPEAEAIVIKNFAMSLPEYDILQHPETGEPWIEEIPHVTIKYGLLEGVRPESIKNLIPRPLHGICGSLGFFEVDDHDVLYIAANGVDLHSANHAISSNLPCAESEYQYTPHITVAYLKKGAGEKYSGMSFFDGVRFTFDNLIFSDHQNNRFPIIL